MIKAEKVFDEVFSARNFNSSPLTISNLDGDFYDYELVMQAGDCTQEFQLLINSDTGSNYRDYYMRGYSTTKNAAVSDSATFINMRNESNTARRGTSLSKLAITGSSGGERYIDATNSSTGSSSDIIYKKAHYWKNTVDSISSLTIRLNSSATADAHIMLYRTPKASGQSEWELMKTDEINQSAMNTTGYEVASGLDLDTDGEYKVTIENGNLTAGVFWIRLNDINLTNEYTTQRIRNNGGGLTSSSTVNYPSIYPTGENDFGGASFTISGSTGNKRLIKGSVPSNHGVAEQCEFTAWWNNTVDNLTSIQLYSNSSSTMTGTMKLYRRRNPAGTGDTLPFEVMYNKDVNQSMPLASKITFSNLGGESSNLIKIEGNFESGINTASATALRYQINGDTGSNYVSQRLMAISSATSAAASTAGYGIGIQGISNTQVSKMTMYIYPKSGDNRPILVHVSSGENRIGIYGQWWNNSVDEIDSISFYTGASTTVIGNIKISRLV